MRRAPRAPSLAFALATLALAASVAFALLRVGGFATFVITGRSMEPAIPVGSLTLVQPVPASTIRSGDVITYVTGRQARTHRVVAVNEDGSVITKGDANEAADPESLAFVGRAGLVRAHVPYLGYVVGNWKQHAPVAGAVSTVLCLALLLRSVRRRSPLEAALERSRRGDRAGAIALLQQAVRRDPLDRVAHRRLAAALASGGDAHAAADEYARFIRAARARHEHIVASEELSYANAIFGRPRGLALRRVA